MAAAEACRITHSRGSWPAGGFDAEIISGFDALAHRRHRCGHRVESPGHRHLTGGGAGDDVGGLAGDDSEDRDPACHERIELRRDRAFVGLERTEADESGIGPLPVGGELRPGMLREELDGDAVLLPPSALRPAVSTPSPTMRRRTPSVRARARIEVLRSWERPTVPT